ncbi:DsrE family protein [Pontibacter liquoris]|uniref:DsrE family protein n=1 Tax=Pontibacter liquoris TaxID=2905677 RepID=UPI001FA6E3C6|nr:DsrE family protein [Pontibacter liquoris]
MKYTGIIIFALCLLATPAAFAQASNTAKTTTTPRAAAHRIVYDVVSADSAQQAGLFRQLNNIKRGWPDAQIEVVIHGKGLEMIQTAKTRSAEAIKSLQAKGVTFAACENTMRAMHVTKEELLPAVITVPMGVGEIVLKQEEGWSYIKF